MIVVADIRAECHHQNYDFSSLSMTNFIVERKKRWAYYCLPLNILFDIKVHEFHR